MSLTPFHLAIPVHDIAVANRFYGDILGCQKGRSSDVWTDFNLFGHQLVCHEVKAIETRQAAPAASDLHHNLVDGFAVPVPHFGVVLTMEKWREFRDRLERLQVEFVIAPYIRFAGLPGEQATMFFLDPSGNALEFKAFADIDAALFDPG